MEKLTIELSKKEFRNLLELAYLGNWMINSHRYNVLEEYESTLQKIYSYAATEESEKLVEFDKEEEVFFLGKNVEDILSIYIDEYDDYTFWEELVYELAERDFFRKYTQKEIDNMPPEKIFLEKDEMAKQYLREFDESGLDNILILKSLYKN